MTDRPGSTLKLFFLLALAGAVCAAPRPSAGADPAPVSRQLSLTYEIYVGGMNAVRLGVNGVLTDDRYDLGMRLATKGMASWILDWRMTAESRGLLRGGRVQPVVAAGDSVWRGTARRERIEFGAAGPVSIDASPPYESEEAEPVPRALMGGSRDLTAALFSSLLAVGRQGRCDHAEKVYDAGGLYLLTMVHEGTQRLAGGEGRAYSGQSLVCRLKIRWLAGRKADEDGPDANGREARIWLAPVFENAPPVPVRLYAETGFGTLQGYLSQGSLTPTAPAPAGTVRVAAGN